VGVLPPSLELRLENKSPYVFPKSMDCLKGMPLTVESAIRTQVWANPAQGMGTVRVVISEGINQGPADSVMFVRLRNIVTFSFQHAPLRKCI